MINFLEDLDDAFFTDFSRDCLIEKNNNTVKIIFYNNFNNYQKEVFTIHQNEIRILMKEKDYINYNVLKNDVLIIDEVSYLVESIEQKTKGVKQLILIYKEE